MTVLVVSYSLYGHNRNRTSGRSFAITRIHLDTPDHRHERHPGLARQRLSSANRRRWFEATLSGRTHDKAVLIITGFLRNKYGQKRPLTLSASLAFEQTYNGIEGDSAGAAQVARRPVLNRTRSSGAAPDAPSAQSRCCAGRPTF
jgi:hypothetical protein